jgi:hypothetical protein
VTELNARINARLAELKAGAAKDKPAALPQPQTPKFVEVETEWQRLVRNARDERSAHEDLKAQLERAKVQAHASKGAGGDQLELLDPAGLPIKALKGAKQNAAMGGSFFALVLALVYAYARVLFSDKLIDGGDVEALDVLPVLGVIPKVSKGTKRSALSKSSSLVAGGSSNAL